MRKSILFFGLVLLNQVMIASEQIETPFISVQDKKTKDLQAVQTLLNSVNLAKTARLNLDRDRRNTDISKMSMRALAEFELIQSLEYYPLIKNVNEATECYLLKNVHSAKDIQTGMKVARKIKSNDCSDDCTSWYLCCCSSRADQLSFDCEKEEKRALKAIELMERE